MTLFIVTNWVGGEWKKYTDAFAKGHEIASHNQEHNSNASGIVPSHDAIVQNVPGEKCVSMAYPNCNTPGDAQVLQTYLAGRNCNGQVNSATPSNWAQIGSKMFGAGQCNCPNDAGSMNSFADQAASSNGWAVTCHHGIGSDNHSWAVTSLDAMKGHLEYLDENRDKIWCETFGNVARYIKERDAASVSEKSSDDNSFTIEVTDDLDDETFDFPLTLRRPLPDGWKEDEVNVKQGETEMACTVVADGSNKLIQFEAVPDGGDVVISSGSTAVRHGHLNGPPAGSGCVRLLDNELILVSGDRKMSVRLFGLTGRLLAACSLNGNSGVVRIPLTDEITRSAFIVKVNGSGISYTKKIVPPF
jgi:oligosaccharide reducing-end xylanase